MGRITARTARKLRVPEARHSPRQNACSPCSRLPKKVLLNHGWRDFVHRLRALGIEAEYLEENAQLSLL